uniref:Protein shisa-5 n=2 Tax=Taeniopygia guttata TaxID=59729 RepID=A0A674HRS0_TAEGU
MVVISHRLDSMIFRGLFQPKLFSAIAMRRLLSPSSNGVGEQELQPGNGEQGSGSAEWGTESGGRGPPRRCPVPGPPRPVSPAGPAASRGPPPPCAPRARSPSWRSVGACSASASASASSCCRRPVSAGRCGSGERGGSDVAFGGRDHIPRGGPVEAPGVGSPRLSSDAEDPLEAVKKITEEMRKLTSTNWISDSDIFEDPDDFNFSGLSFGAITAIGVTVFAVIVITIILCLTCSCCCLYKACRRPRPVVTTTATTTVVHSAYPQQPAVPPSYPAAPYQGYQPVAVQPQPGMPAAPYPAQYPPPYPMQPAGPPAYHETVAAGAGAPYPTQPPYNPAYMDPQKPTY